MSPVSQVSPEPVVPCWWYLPDPGTLYILYYYTTLYYTTLHYTTLHYMKLHYTTLH